VKAIITAITTRIEIIVLVLFNLIRCYVLYKYMHRFILLANNEFVFSQHNTDR